MKTLEELEKEINTLKNRVIYLEGQNALMTQSLRAMPIFQLQCTTCGEGLIPNQHHFCKGYKVTCQQPNAS